MRNLIIMYKEMLWEGDFVVVYGDLLFLINFSMDFLCFYISCLLLHQKMPTLRAVLASVLGGSYSVAALFISASSFQALLIDAFVLILMCVIVYLRGGVSFLGMLKRIFLYFFVSALLGGLMTALFSLLNRVEAFSGDLGMGDGIDAWMFAALVIIGSIITLNGGRIFRSSSSRGSATLILESELGKVELCALIDSGNLAVEPISGKSVAFVSVEKCKKIIENSMYDALKNNSNINDIPIGVMSKIRMVPTQVISGKLFLPAIKFKKAFVSQGKKKKNIDVYIALVNEEYLGEYDAIISHETII